MKTELLAGLALTLALAAPARAEWLELSNGDRYTGKVQAVHGDTIEFQSEILGLIKLPRAKVAAIYFHAAPPAKNAATSPTPSPTPEAPAAATNSPAQLKTFQDLQQELASSPEAKQKFNEMLGSLFSGKISMDDLRAQAQQAVRQMEDLKSELGDDAGAFDGYLAILNNFLKQTNSASPFSKTNSPPKAPAPVAPSHPEPADKR